MIVLGGLGGGGDVGLALVLAEHSRLWPRLGAVVSFARCRPVRRWSVGERVRGALVRVRPWSVPSKRFFEDKIQDIVGDVPVYVVCVEADMGSIVEGLEWAAREHGATCMLHADLGGDSLVLGYEDRMGSYTTDTLARAALSLVSRRTGARTLVVAGLVGGEGGGGELSLFWLAAALRLLRERAAILGVESPGPESAWPARTLLGRAESGMLPLYLAALEGREWARVSMAYLHGRYRVMPWYRHVLVVDERVHCSVSPICVEAARYGRGALRRWRPPRPQGELARILRGLRAVERREGERGLEGLVNGIFEELAGRGGVLARLCR